MVWERERARRWASLVAIIKRKSHRTGCCATRYAAKCGAANDKFARSTLSFFRFIRRNDEHTAIPRLKLINVLYPPPLALHNSTYSDTLARKYSHITMSISSSNFFHDSNNFRGQMVSFFYTVQSRRLFLYERYSGTASFEIPGGNCGISEGGNARGEIS